MFTGLVQHLGQVLSLDLSRAGARLQVDAHRWAHQPSPGDSIAVNGCCLTIAPAADNAERAGVLQFDLIRQTLDSTVLAELQPGDHVNLEHALALNSLLGGHLVQGHIDHIGLVNRIVRTPDQVRLRIQPPANAMQFIIERGSIAVDGVSLTVSSVADSWFEVALIPATLKLTNLGRLTEGARVNLETDYIAKIVVSQVNRQRRA